MKRTLLLGQRFLMMASVSEAAMLTLGCGESAPTDRVDASTIPDGGADIDSGTAAPDSAGACVAGLFEPCYSGPTSTDGKGACHSGIRVCLPDGSGFGECQGEVTPTLETCATLVDDDCDGLVNEDGADCACKPGEAASCYSGAVETMNVGQCHSGVQVCKQDGTGYGPCLNEVLPQAETCTTLLDDDCDGQTNEEGVGLRVLSGGDGDLLLRSRGYGGSR